MYELPCNRTMFSRIEESGSFRAKPRNRSEWTKVEFTESKRAKQQRNDKTTSNERFKIYSTKVNPRPHTKPKRKYAPLPIRRLNPPRPKSLHLKKPQKQRNLNFYKNGFPLASSTHVNIT